MEAPPDDYGTIARFYDRIIEPMNAPLWTIGMQLHPVGSGDVVLDVGCGTGSHLARYVESGAECHGIDLSRAMLDVAKERLGGAARLELGSGTTLPYADDRFDLAFASLLLHELDADTRSKVLSEMVRVTKPDGRLLVIDYRAGSLRFRGRVRRLLSHAMERAAGSSHYRQWRLYQGAGGLPGLLPDTLQVDREKIVSGGNLAVWLLARQSEASTGGQ